MWKRRAFHPAPSYQGWRPSNQIALSIVEDPESVTFIGGGRKAPRDMKPCQPDEDQVNRPIVTA